MMNAADVGPMTDAHDDLHATATDPPLPALGELSERIAEFIQVGVCAVLVVVWAIVGFVFWIPFLVRSIAIYTGAVLASSFMGSRLDRAQRGLDTAVRFWFGGFEAVMNSRRAHNYELDLEVNVTMGSMLAMLLHHLVFTALFWGSTVSLWLAVSRGWL